MSREIAHVIQTYFVWHLFRNYVLIVLEISDKGGFRGRPYNLFLGTDNNQILVAYRSAYYFCIFCSVLLFENVPPFWDIDDQNVELLAPENFLLHNKGVNNIM